MTGTVKVFKKVMQPMPGCDINSTIVFSNLSIDCQITVQPVPNRLKVDDDDQDLVTDQHGFRAAALHAAVVEHSRQQR